MAHGKQAMALSAKMGPVDSSNARSTLWDFRYPESDGTAHGTGLTSALESVFRTVAIGPGPGAPTFWSMSYDGDRRRIRKSDPTGNSTDYFWGQALELLEDRGFTQTVGGLSYNPTDEYIWLGGRPVVAIRGRLESGARVADGTGACDRLGDGVNCSTNFPVTDLVGRPIVTMDQTMKIASVGEYEPFGHVNRMRVNYETQHDYVQYWFDESYDLWWTAGYPEYSDLNWSFSQPLQGMELKTRAHFPMVDLESCGGTQYDYLEVQTPAGATLTPRYSGRHAGNVWTSWASLTSTAGQARVRFHSDDTNRAPCQKSCELCTDTYRGATFTDVEYRRFQTGASQFQPLLRGAGQYYDQETDLFENWNRYLDATSDMYLATEPILQSPEYVASMASNGTAVPAYAYALDNPLRYVDRDGRGPIDSAVASFMLVTGLVWPSATVSLRNAAGPGGSPIYFPVVEGHPLQPAGYTTTYGSVVCSPGPISAATWNHERQHLVQAIVLSPFDLYHLGHLASQAWSYATTGTYSQANPLEVGPYSTPPRPWP